LNEAANIEAIRQFSRVGAQQKKGHPMRNDGEGAEGRRVEFLKHHPVTDDVFDVVGHHCRGRGEEIDPKVNVENEVKARCSGKLTREALVSGFNCLGCLDGVDVSGIVAESGQDSS